MAQQIEDSFDFSRRRKTHDFGEYADGMVWKLTRGEDYLTTGATVLMHARKWAKDNEMEIESKVIHATDHTPENVVLRFNRRPPWE